MTLLTRNTTHENKLKVLKILPKIEKKPTHKNCTIQCMFEKVFELCFWVMFMKLAEMGNTET